MKTLHLALLSTMALSVALWGCKKNQLNKDTTSAEDHALAQQLWDDVGDQCEQSASIHAVENPDQGEWKQCAIVTFDTTPGLFPLTVTLDFGDVGCTGPDGRVRKGKVIYTISGPYRNAGSSITVTTDDYFVDDYKVEGTRVATNEGENSSGQLTYRVEVTDGKIISPDNEGLTWSSTRTRTWVEGQETGFFTLNSDSTWMGWDGLLDDVYEITGTAEGTDRSGRAYTLEITTALRVQADCRWVTEGILELSPEGLRTRVVDYGDGTCDDDATVTVGRHEYPITLRG